MAAVVLPLAHHLLFWKTMIHIHLCIIWLLLHYNGRIECCDGDLLVHKVENIYSLTLCRKSLLIPVLEEWDVPYIHDLSSPHDICQVFLWIRRLSSQSQNPWRATPNFLQSFSARMTETHQTQSETWECHSWRKSRNQKLADIY